jgi:hypothetical protein
MQFNPLIFPAPKHKKQFLQEQEQQLNIVFVPKGESRKKGYLNALGCGGFY